MTPFAPIRVPPRCATSRRFVGTALGSFLSSAVLGIAGCQAPVEQQPNLAEVEAVERARFQAWMSADTEAMRPMLADDLLYCHSTGECQNKEEIVAAIGSKNTIYKQMDIISMTPRAVGPAAVLINGKLDIIAESVGSEPVHFQGIYTDVYVKRDGRWQMASWQSTSLRPTPP